MDQNQSLYWCQWHEEKKNKTSSNRGAARDITASIEVVLSNSVHYFPTEIFRWGMGTNHMLKEWW